MLETISLFKMIIVVQIDQSVYQLIILVAGESIHILFTFQDVLEVRGRENIQFFLQEKAKISFRKSLTTSETST